MGRRPETMPDQGEGWWAGGCQVARVDKRDYAPEMVQGRGEGMHVGGAFLRRGLDSHQSSVAVICERREVVLAE